MKAGIAYWSGTGNTEAMAQMFEAALAELGAEVESLSVSDGALDVTAQDVVLLGCPAMGSEELESDEFEPYLDSIEADLKDKKVALFGSYDWGTGEWMDTFKERMEGVGANVLGTVIANNEPDDDCNEEIKALCKMIAG